MSRKRWKTLRHGCAMPDIPPDIHTAKKQLRTAEKALECSFRRSVHTCALQLRVSTAQISRIICSKPAFALPWYRNEFAVSAHLPADTSQVSPLLLTGRNAAKGHPIAEKADYTQNPRALIPPLLLNYDRELTIRRTRCTLPAQRMN